MTDTPPEIEERYRRMLLALSPGERVRMACRMFTSGRTLMMTGLVAKDGDAQRREIFVRLYGDLVTGTEREAILQAIAPGQASADPH